ncbi:hypothetical protein [Microvirga roseola]|uniref:hypothetical protein n=1 Tax=Microvirga roseola TaxID=2883126 RepID=UPI001E56F187|nr:hypothetical protein [Microvirga roseola]
MFLYDLLQDPAILPGDDPEAVDVPDFVRPDYPFDLPPYRRAFFARVFDAAGVPQHCPVAECRRTRHCQGSDGPPCYRADRDRLNRLLFRVWVASRLMNEQGIFEVAAQLEQELGGPPLKLPEGHPAIALSGGDRRGAPRRRGR